MAADPNYNPMNDPAAVASIESMIPDSLRDMPNAIERLKVAFKDAIEGSEAVSDLDSLPSVLTKEEAISSPQSKWFKEKYPDSDPAFSDSAKEDLLQKVKSEHPEVPMP
eukprot:CAMPEP_0182427458 /NCGR_PEP_ID=MMETSP1167-20130531/17211_1 /TAXON_ID=2988 /ORGANISM="Mallomonas Sp, Strain CCMP3275" /LENGTH=108 /DNA_ID=CAMNT_0024609703 /DNA_START=196 /DNA_END=522 /DNA_ORIENTATION=+